METYYYNVVETSESGESRMLESLAAQYLVDLDAQGFAERMLRQRLDPSVRRDPLPAVIEVNVWKTEVDAESGQEPDAVARWSAEPPD